jgi:hypothetical protein
MSLNPREQAAARKMQNGPKEAAKNGSQNGNNKQPQEPPPQPAAG